MKTKRFLSITLSLAVVGILFAGCGGTNAVNKTRDTFFKPVPVEPVTNTFSVYEYSDVLTPAKTNLESGVITPAVPKPGATSLGTVTVVVQPPPKEFEDNAANQESAKAITSAIPVYGGLATLGLTAIFGLSKLWLNRKKQPLLTSTFTALETWMNSAQASGDPKAQALAASLKQALAKAHDYADVAAEAQKLVDAYTGHSSTAQDVLKALEADKVN